MADSDKTQSNNKAGAKDSKSAPASASPGGGSADGGGALDKGPAKEASPKSSPSGGRADISGKQAAEEVIAKFGGIRPMASKLNLAVSTVQGWKERGAIPAGRHDDIIEAAKSQSIDLTPELVKASDQSGPASGGGAAANDGKAASAKADSGKSDSGKPAATAAATTTAAAGSKASQSAGQSAAPSSGQAGGQAGGNAASGGSTTASAAKSPSSSASTASSSASKTPAASASASAPARPTPPAPPPAKSGGGVGAFLLGAFVLAAGAAGAIFTQPYWQPYLGHLVPAAATSGDSAQEDSTALQAAETNISDNAAAVASLQQRIAALEDVTAPGGSSSAAPDTSALEGEVSSLKDQVTSLDNQIKALSDRIEEAQQASSASGDDGSAAELAKLTEEAASLSSRMSANEQKLDQLDSLSSQVKEIADHQSGATRAAGKEIAMLLASVQFRDALLGSGPFEAALQAVEPFGKDDPALAEALAPLAPYAAHGVPTLADLQASFSDTAAAVVAADPTSPDDSWAEGVLKRISSVVTIRPVGMAEGDSTGAIVARAETKLNGGDLSGALGELDSLSGDAQGAAAAWRNEARSRLDADKAMAALSAAVSGQFAGKGG